MTALEEFDDGGTILCCIEDVPRRSSEGQIPRRFLERNGGERGKEGGEVSFVPFLPRSLGRQRKQRDLHGYSPIYADRVVIGIPSVSCGLGEKEKQRTREMGLGDRSVELIVSFLPPVRCVGVTNRKSSLP